MPAITGRNRRWWVLAAMTGCLSMIFVDSTGVAVALPTIQRELGMSQSELQWVVNAYLLTLAAFVALGGRLGAMLGHGRVLKLGVLIYVSASAACGFAQSGELIIVARAVQGVGGALMLPPSVAIAINAFSASERGQAMGISAGIADAFLALGPLIGGLLTQSASWRAVFWVNIPIGVAVLAVAYAAVPADQGQRTRMDYPGLVTLVVGLGALVVALMQSESWGWGSTRVVGLLVVAAVLLPIFIAIEARGSAPLVQLRLFASHNFGADVAVMAAVQFGLAGVTVLGVIWTQNALGFSPTLAGVALLPLTVALLFTSPLAGRVFDRAGPRALVVGGAALFAAGLIANAAVMAQLSYPWLVPGLVAMGIGIGMVLTPANTDAMSSASVELRGEASGVTQTVRRVGATIGLAVMGVVVVHVWQSRIVTIATARGATPAQARGIASLLSEPGAKQRIVTHHPPAELIHQLKQALATAVSSAYYVAAGVLVVAAVVALLALTRMRAADEDALAGPDELGAPGPAV